MKLTEAKGLSWDNIEKLDYIYKHRGRKHLRQLSNNSLDKSKKHLGVIEAKNVANDDSPSYRTKPAGRRHAADIAKSTKPIIIDGASYYPSLLDPKAKKK